MDKDFKDIPEKAQRAVIWGFQRIYWRLVSDGFDTEADAMLCDEMLEEFSVTRDAFLHGDWT